MSDDRREDQPGWAAPDLPPREPGTATTTPVPPPTPPAPTGWTQPTMPAGGAPDVPPPHTAPGAPTRTRGKGWLITLIAALATILTITIVGTVLFATRTLPPFNGARHFIDAVKRGDDNAATNRLCSADGSNPQAAIDLIRSTLTDRDTVTVNALGVDRSGSTATVDYTVTYQGGKSSQSYALPMMEENGSWKACPPS